MEYGFNCFADRGAAQSGLTKRLEEMGFLGRDGLRETRMLTSEKLHEGARQLGTNNDQNTVDSADNLKQSKISKSQLDAMSHFSQLLWFALYVFAKSHVSILKCAYPAMGSVKFGVFHSLMTRARQQANDTLPYHCTPYKST